MAAAERAYVALGSNLGDRAGHLRAARAALAALPGTALVGVSAVEETAPLAGMAQPPYLNQMVALETRLTPARAARGLPRDRAGPGAGARVGAGAPGRWISTSCATACGA